MNNINRFHSVTPVLSNAYSGDGLFDITVNDNDLNFKNMMNKASQKLESLIRQSNDSSYNYSHVMFENANFALDVMKAIYVANMLEPQIVPGYNGDLQIEWHDNDIDLEIYIKGIYDIEVWYNNHNSGQEEDMNIKTDFSALKTIVNLLTKRNDSALAA